MSTVIDEQRLERIVLAGTARTNDAVPLPASLMDNIPEGPDAREHAALLAAGSVALMRKAGSLPIPADRFTAWPVAPDEHLALLGPMGRQCLQALLEREDRDLLDHYVTLLAAHQRRVPEFCIVPLLELARGQRALEQRLMVQCGARGAWLAARNPEWRSLMHASANEDAWGTGSIAQRAAHLQELRKTDPAAGRELLAAGIKQETSKDLVVLLDALRTGLSLNDAPLLEALLKAKARDVRSTAAVLLARMPDHPLQRSLIALVSPLLVMKGNMILGRKLEVALPEAYDKSWAQLGIEPKSDLFPTERTAWLGQMLALIDPRHWAATFDRHAEDLVALAVKNEFASTLLAAWTDAALLHEDRPMATALLKQALRPKFDHERAKRLFASFSAQEREELALPFVMDVSEEPDHQYLVAWMLNTCAHDWSTGLGEAIVRRLERMAPKPDDPGQWSMQLPVVFGAMGRSMPPLLASRLETLLNGLRGTAAPAFVKHLEQLTLRLRLRERMIASVHEPPSAS